MAFVMLPIAKPEFSGYICYMSVDGISVGTSLTRVQEAAAIKVTGMAISNQKQQAQDLAKLLNSAQTITDPALGNRVNILA